MRTRLLTTLLLAATLLAAAPSAGAQDTSAVAVNTRDESFVFRLAFHVGRTTQAVVDPSNAAVAFASCEGCRTVAISYQVVLAMSEVDELTAENLALAINQQCTDCDTAAFAYQYVMALGSIVHFTADGNQTLAELRRRVLALRHGSLSDAELQAQLDAVGDELEQVLATELVAPGPPPPPASAAEPAEPTPEPTPAEAQPEPTAEPSPEPSPAETETATPSPTASPTPTPTPAPSEGPG